MMDPPREGVAVCHRPELAKLRFDLEPDQIVTPERMAMLLSSPLAQRKDVGSRPYAVLLNQADRARSVLQKYFIPSGIVMRACSQIRKKLSIVVRLVKMTALCSNISTR